MKTKLLISSVLLLSLAAYLLFSGLRKPFVYEGEKFCGLSFVAPRHPLDSLQMARSGRVDANFLALMPYAFLPENESELRFVKVGERANHAHQWWGEQPEGIGECIALAEAQGFKLMLKPHIWLGRGFFTGDLSFDSEADWKTFEKSYTAYLLQYARLAESEGVQLFCIGTELVKMVDERPCFWPELIREIRKVYNGKLTYAENWDSFTEVPFWGQLDFIGIDGYFPLSKQKDPDLETLKKGWEKHIKSMGHTASEFQKPILFTEYGYRSCDFSTEKPWEVNYDLQNNLGLQARAFEAFYQEVWGQPWFAGGFVWKWFPDKDPERESLDKFCPQGKPAEQVIKTHYEISTP